MCKNLLFLVSFMFPNLMFCQFGINTHSPRGALDIISSNSGLLIPTVTITDVNSETIINPQGGSIVDGTLIFNSLDSKFYFWQNLKWNKIMDSNKDTNLQAKSTVNSNNNFIPNFESCSGLNHVFTNNNEVLFVKGGGYIKIPITVSNLTGVICDVTISVNLRSLYLNDIDLFLISPSGKILELSTNNITDITGDFIVTFSDNATTSIIYNNTNGTYKPEGGINKIPYGIVPNITAFSGYKTDNPNGIWYLLISDFFRDNGTNTNPDVRFRSTQLSISTTNQELDYKLVEEKQINSLSGKNILINSSYSAIPNLNNLQTVITKTTSPIVNNSIQQFGTNYIKLSVSNQCKNNNQFVQLVNETVDEVNTENTIYYYQLWSKGGPNVPNINNQQHSLILSTIDK